MIPKASFDYNCNCPECRGRGEIIISERVNGKLERIEKDLPNWEVKNMEVKKKNK